MSELAHVDHVLKRRPNWQAYVDGAIQAQAEEITCLRTALAEAVEALEFGIDLARAYREAGRMRDAGDVVDVVNESPTVRKMEAALVAARAALEASRRVLK